MTKRAQGCFLVLLFLNMRVVLPTKHDQMEILMIKEEAEAEEEEKRKEERRMTGR